MATGIDIRILTGSTPGLAAHVPDLARLRITVFREFPYLYDGTTAYEEKYLQTYLDCPESVVILALDQGQVIGASTGLPLEFETPEFKQPFTSAGLAPASIFYCGESVLLASSSTDAKAMRAPSGASTAWCCAPLTAQPTTRVGPLIISRSMRSGSVSAIRNPRIS